MSIVIPDMEMPKTCRRCLEIGIPVRCRVKEQEPITAVMSGYDRPNDCPLIELPLHGRLKDADKTLDELREYPQSVLLCEPDIANRIYEIIYDAPTVLEASEERE